VRTPPGGKGTAAARVSMYISLSVPVHRAAELSLETVETRQQETIDNDVALDTLVDIGLWGAR
jgi:hypothetical protein